MTQYTHGMKNVILIIAFLIAAAFVGRSLLEPVACGAACESAAAAVPRRVTVSALDFDVESKKPGIVLLDVRTAEEFSQGHLAGARNADFNNTEIFSQTLASLDKQKTYLIYCRSGNRSARALEQMKAAGFSSVINLDGGIQAWQAVGLPVDR